jgi:hypothetical protein
MILPHRKSGGGRRFHAGNVQFITRKVSMNITTNNCSTNSNSAADSTGTNSNSIQGQAQGQGRGDLEGLNSTLRLLLGQQAEVLTKINAIIENQDRIEIALLGSNLATNDTNKSNDGLVNGASV